MMPAATMRTAPFFLLASVAMGLGAMGGCQPRGHASLPTSAATPAPRVLPDDGMVDVGGGRSLFVHCVGSGSPLVLLDECSGCQATTWRSIQPAIGRFTRACAYDRAGVGYSDEAPKPHLVKQIVGELRTLLGEHDESGPVVLVGQGSGGLFDQIYARDYPRSVVGMVLVDTATQDYTSRYYAAFPPEVIARMKADAPEPPENFDYDDQGRAQDDLQKAPLSLGDRPLVVLNHGKRWEPLYGIPDDTWDGLEVLWHQMQADATSLSKNALHVVAREAAWIPDEAPDRVVGAVWDVVRSARTGVALSRLPAESPPAATDAAAPVTPPHPRGIPIDDGLVDVGGGMSLHIHCVGHGAPAVVMDAGHGADGTTWGKVLGDIGRLTRACVYDRAGLGLSSPAPHPHPLPQIAREMHTLLERAGVPGPYVLVGHSQGGLVVRLFHADHPEEVAGMVMVDVSNEFVGPVISPDKARAEMKNDREGIDYDTWQAGLDALRASKRPLGDMPLVVLSAGQMPPPRDATAVQAAEFKQRWLASHDQLVRLSTNSTHVIADRAFHFIQNDAPKLVIASVKEVVEAVRTHGRVDAKALEPFAHDGPPPPPPEAMPASAPNTPPKDVQPFARKRFEAWLDAFNSRDREKIRAFLVENPAPDETPADTDRDVERDMRFGASTGGFDLKKAETDTPLHFRAVLKERASDQYARLTLEVEPGEPHRLVNLDIRAIEPPDDMLPPRGTESETLKAVQQRIESAVAGDAFSGAVLVAKNGAPVFARAYGLADRDRKTANGLSTRFRIGSMNKMFTAVAIMQLVQAKKISLTDTVGKLVPDYPNKNLAAKVTVAQLLSHTGGTGDIFGPEFDAHRDTLRTLDDYVKLYGSRDLEFEPGSRWSYSNYGFILLGVIIERVTGHSYYDWVSTHVFKPAGMTSTDSLPEDQPVAKRSVGYMKDDAGGAWQTNASTLPYRGTSAGGGYSTVEDLLRFANALRGHKLLDAEHTELLTRGKTDTGHGSRSYGYGFGDQTIGGVRCFGHNGGAPGMNGTLAICESGYTIAVLANLDPPAAERVGEFLEMRLPLR